MYKNWFFFCVDNISTGIQEFNKSHVGRLGNVEDGLDALADFMKQEDEQMEVRGNVVPK